MLMPDQLAEANGVVGAQNSFQSRPPLGGGRDRIESIELRLTPLGDLGPAVPPRWLWAGYLARGAVTLLTGLWKGGKSTLLAHLLRDLTRGSGLVSRVIDGPILVLSEESGGIWATRRDDLGLSHDQIIMVESPTLGRPDDRTWRGMIQSLAECVHERGVALVVIDTLPTFWPVGNENDASEVMDALLPLRALTEAGAAVLLIHHPKKGDGSQGTAARGSGALSGFADILVELRRYAPEDNADRRRKLTVYGRFEDCPPETVIELTDDGYIVIGDTAETRQAETEVTITRILADAGEAMTVVQIIDARPATPRIGKTKLRNILADGVGTRWGSSGKGVKHDPLLYFALPGGGADSFQSPLPLGGDRD